MSHAVTAEEQRAAEGGAPQSRGGDVLIDVRSLAKTFRVGFLRRKVVDAV